MTSELKIDFLKSLNIDVDHLEELSLKHNQSYERMVSYDKRIILDSNDYTSTFILPFCIKDIVGTTHPSYYNKTFVEAFLESKRGDTIIKKYKENPDYYFKDLKSKEQDFLTHDTPIELLRMEDGSLYIKGGNNRVYLLMMLYLSEMKKTTTEEEQKLINNKYTFYAEVRSLPKNKDVTNAILLLKEKYNQNIKFKFIGNSPDDCKYIIDLNNSVIEINSIEELLNLLKHSFIPQGQTFHTDLFILLDIYIQCPDVNKKELLQRVIPDIELIKEKYKEIRRITGDTSVFYNIDTTNKTTLEVLEKIVNDLQQNSSFKR